MFLTVYYYYFNILLLLGKDCDGKNGEIISFIDKINSIYLPSFNAIRKFWWKIIPHVSSCWLFSFIFLAAENLYVANIFYEMESNFWKLGMKGKVFLCQLAVFLSHQMSPLSSEFLSFVKFVSTNPLKGKLYEIFFIFLPNLEMFFTL